MTEIVAPVEPPAEDAEEEGFLETTLSCVYEPVVALRHVTSAPHVGWAIAISIAVSIASVISSTTAPQPLTGPAFPPPPVVVQVIVFPIAGLLGLLLGASILQLTSRVLGGKGTFKSLFVGLAFAGIPTVFQIPIQLIGVGIGGDSGLLLAGVLNSVIAIWIITLGVIAVRETHSFTTGRALGATALATLAIIVLAIVLVVAVLAVTIGTVAGLTGA